MKVEQSTTLKKLPTYEYTKQVAKEKFGKAANSVDSYETKLLKEKISHIKHALNDVKATGKDYIDHLAVLAEKGAAFSDALSALGRESLSDTTIGTTIFMVGDVVKNHSVSTRASSMCTSSQVVTPLIKIYEEEFQTILNLKADQERLRIEYEAQRSRLQHYQKRSAKRLSQVVSEVSAAKESYDRITGDLLSRCDALIAEMEVSLMPSLQSYISFQAAFFTNLSEQWKRMEKTVQTNATQSRVDRVNGAGDTFSPPFHFGVQQEPPASWYTPVNRGRSISSPVLTGPRYSLPIKRPGSGGSRSSSGGSGSGSSLGSGSSGVEV